MGRAMPDAIDQVVQKLLDEGKHEGIIANSLAIALVRVVRSAESEHGMPVSPYPFLNSAVINYRPPKGGT